MANGNGSDPLASSAHGTGLDGHNRPRRRAGSAASGVPDRRAGIPSTVLYAVALQESGLQRDGRLVPWPWTLNVAGAPHRFSSRAKACAGLQKALREVPPTRVDAGLGQVNLGYQKHRYPQPCDLLDPYRNLAIAAEILREQHTDGEDWLLAIGRYHRPAGGVAAARYRASVHKHLQRVLGGALAENSLRRKPL